MNSSEGMQKVHECDIWLVQYFSKSYNSFIWRINWFTDNLDIQPSSSCHVQVEIVRYENKLLFWIGSFQWIDWAGSQKWAEWGDEQTSHLSVG